MSQRWGKKCLLCGKCLESDSLSWNLCETEIKLIKKISCISPNIKVSLSKMITKMKVNILSSINSAILSDKN
jgi:hypothetical protein